MSLTSAAYGEAEQDRESRCPNCHRKLAELLTRPWVIVCGRCKRRITNGTE